MTNEEILKKAIEKAKINGYDYIGWAFIPDNEYTGFNLDNRILYKNQYGAEEVDEVSYYDVIFSHSFAKAFFGEILDTRYECKKCQKERGYTDYSTEQEYCQLCGSKRTLIKIAPWDQPWKDKLQEMVLKEEPLKYLEKFL